MSLRMVTTAAPSGDDSPVATRLPRSPLQWDPAVGGPAPVVPVPGSRVSFSCLVALLASASLTVGCLVGPQAGAPAKTAAAPGSPPVPPRPDGPSGLPLPSKTGVPRPAGQPGNLKILDWAGFKAAVSYTFDDANASQIAHYRELQALGVRMTFYLITGKPEASDAVWLAAAKDGHEIGNHSKSHAHAGTGEDIDRASAFIHDQIGVTAWTMAAPFGDGSYRALAPSRFLFNRGVQSGLVGPQDETDPFVLPCFIPAERAPASAFDDYVTAAGRGGKWAIVLIHGFVGGSDGAYKAVRFDDFSEAVRHARAHDDLWIDSLINVGAYWWGQKVVAAANPAGVGAATPWTWTLPPHFPPHRFVRVTVDGGTLIQNEKPLAWDEHGYYEVALDAGSLTLRP